MHDNKTSSEPKASRVDDANGSAGPQTKATDQHDTVSPEEARRQSMQRAEELVDRWGEQIGQYASQFGHTILKWAARAREEAEDIWAEAQAIRERQQNQKD